MTIVGLLLIAVGTGGIKPCVSAFGGDQFKLPEQRAELAKFFSLFYFAINAGSMISTTVTPMLRADVYCFGENDCYSLAFGVPAVLMMFSMLIFVMGKNIYKLHPPSGNAIFGVSQTVTYAFKGWQQETGKRTLPFLDYATPVVGHQMVEETKCLFKILLLYVPFPMFWALADQQGSRWTFQAAHMDGSIGSLSIKPDQMQVINPLLILIFIPLFDCFVYPGLARIGIRRPLQKLSLGLLLAAIGFLLSAMVELRLEEKAPAAFPDAADIVHLRIYNGMPCRYEFVSDLGSAAGGTPYEHSIEPLGMWSHLGLYVPAPAEYVFRAEPQAGKKNCPNIEGRIVLEPGTSTSYFLAQGALQKFSDGLKSSLAKRSKKPPLLRTLFNTPRGEGPIKLRASSSSAPGVQLDSGNLSALHEIAIGRGELDINGKRAASFEARNGGLYSLLVEGNANDGYVSRSARSDPGLTFGHFYAAIQHAAGSADHVSVHALAAAADRSHDCSRDYVLGHGTRVLLHTGTAQYEGCTAGLLAALGGHWQPDGSLYCEGEVRQLSVGGVCTLRNDNADQSGHISLSVEELHVHRSHTQTKTGARGEVAKM